VEELEDVDIGAVVELLLLKDMDEVLETVEATEELWAGADDDGELLLVDFEPRAT
jgi:hypothetical protein